MNKILTFFFLFICLSSPVYAARSTQVHFAINGSATAGNLNGGGFNPYNANFPTDLATTNGTSATPTVSAAYAFTAGDVTAGAWVYVKSGTNWIQGFYQITSQSGGVATLNAAVGAAVIWDESLQEWKPSTAQGIATQDTPGGNATYGVDYSQSTAAPWAGITDLASTIGTTNPSTVTSATVGFGSNHVGNFIHITAGTNWTVNGTSTTGLQSWYEIVSVSGGVATLSNNQAVGTAATLSGGTFYLGGALSLGSSTANRIDDAVFEMAGSAASEFGTIYWIKAGTITTGGNIALTAAGVLSSPVKYIGYNSVRGDNPTGTSRPVLVFAGNTFTMAAYMWYKNLIMTGTAAATLTSGTQNKAFNVKSTNLSTTTTRTAFNAGAASILQDSEFISYRGYAVVATSNTAAHLIGCYLHDSDVGYRYTGTANVAPILINNIISNNVTAAIQTTNSLSTPPIFYGNTLYGSANTTGTGISTASSSYYPTINNNIITGFATGVVSPDVQRMSYSNYNNFYNNDVDISASAGGASDSTRFAKGKNDIALDPSFSSVTQITGTTAVILSSNRIQDTSKNFSSLGVTANATPNVGYTDYVYYSAGSGAGVKGVYAITAITTVTNPNDTITVDQTLTADATADHAYQITIGNIFGVGTNMKAAGFPGSFQGGLSAGYMDIGAVQRQETGGTNLLGVIQ
jgi:hypothetical protein